MNNKLVFFVVCLLMTQSFALFAHSIKVTPDTFIRAETDNMFAAMAKNAGGTNRFYHFRKPTPLDKQTVVRMNLDVLYSGGVFDGKKGIVIDFPEVPTDRYVSVFILDNEHYMVDLLHKPGKYTIKGETQFLYVIIRIQLKQPNDVAEVKMVNQLQDQFKITSINNQEFFGLHWDRNTLNALRNQYQKEAKTKFSSYSGMMGKRGEVNEKTRHIAAAGGWGLLPDSEATYFSYAGPDDADSCYVGNYKVPDNKGFWSMTLYGEDGFMKSDNSLLNASNVIFNKDGSFDAHFGSKDKCGDVKNRLDISSGWNFLMRVYRPGDSVLAGDYTFPKVKKVVK